MADAVQDTAAARIESIAVTNFSAQSLELACPSASLSNANPSVPHQGTLAPASPSKTRCVLPLFFDEKGGGDDFLSVGRSKLDGTPDGESDDLSAVGRSKDDGAPDDGSQPVTPTSAIYHRTLEELRRRRPVDSPAGHR